MGVTTISISRGDEQAPAQADRRREFPAGGVGDSRDDMNAGEDEGDGGVTARQLEWKADLAGRADFWAVWERYRPHLFRVCLRAMHGHRADAEDALGQLMLKARAKIPVFSPGIDNVGAWLTRFAYNHCVDLQRKRKRCANLEQRWEELSRIDRTAERCDQVDHCEGSERADLHGTISKAIARLPVRLREPATLRWRENLSYREIATRLGRRIECVRKQVQQARESLRRDLGRFSAPEAGGTKAAPGFAQIGELDVGAGRRKRSDSRRRLVGDAQHVTTRLVSVQQIDGEAAMVPLFLEARPGREKQKIATLRSYIGRHPTGWAFRLKLANLLYATGAWEEAATEFREVLLKRPWLLGATLRLGDVLFHTGRRGEAAVIFATASASMRNPVDAQMLTGLAAWMRGDYAAAVVILRSAADQATPPMPCLHALARCWLDLGAWANALDVLDEWLGHDPYDLVALSLGYDALLALGREDEARRRVQEVLRCSPRDPLANLRLRALCGAY